MNRRYGFAQLGAATRRSSGFSLLEIMVAVLVLSVGLLGMAALMGVSLRNNQGANYRTQATNLSYEILDSIRANMASGAAGCAGYDTGGWTDPDVWADHEMNYDDCGTAAECDIERWSATLARQLPNGRGNVAIVSTGDCFDRDSVTTATIQVCWTDERGEVLEGTSYCDGGGDEVTFTMESGI